MKDFDAAAVNADIQRLTLAKELVEHALYSHARNSPTFNRLMKAYHRPPNARYEGISGITENAIYLLLGIDGSQKYHDMISPLASVIDAIGKPLEDWNEMDKKTVREEFESIMAKNQYPITSRQSGQILKAEFTRCRGRTP